MNAPGGWTLIVEYGPVANKSGGGVRPHLFSPIAGCNNGPDDPPIADALRDMAAIKEAATRNNMLILNYWLAWLINIRKLPK